MKPETIRYLAKAEKCLTNARTMLSVKLMNDAGRTAYLSAFHTAQALIFERTGKITKTHKGVHTEFAKLSLSIQEISTLTGVLPRLYNLKAIADYETDADSDVPLERAIRAIDEACDFLNIINEALHTSFD